MQIDVIYDQPTSSLPVGFVSAISYAVSYFDTLFTNNVTVDLHVGYGEIDGQALGSNALGESDADYVSENYSAVRNALLAQGAPGSLTLPSTAPQSGTLYMPQAEAQALGLTSAGSSIYVGFSSTLPVSYTPTVTPSSNAYYFVGVAEHEISEDLGRVSLLDYQPNDYSTMDLFRYSSAGVRDNRTGGSGSTAYFSIDNGATNLGTWNNRTSGGDLGDWYPSGPAPGGDDAFNDYSSPGVINVVSANDITLMEALGWVTGSGQLTGDSTNPPASTNPLDPTNSPDPTTPPDPAPNDFTGNGISDMLWRNSSGSLSEWLMNGATISSSAAPTFNGSAVALDSSWNVVGIGDFNNSGDDGVLWQQSTTGSLTMWLMNGTTISAMLAPTFEGRAITPNSTWSIAGIGDFGGKGNDDIVWRQNTGALAEWMMNGSNITSSAIPGFGGNAVSPDSSWSIAGIGDFNGDGDDDILWRQNTGALSEWTMNGSTIASSAALTSNGGAVAPDSSWSIVAIGNFSGNGDNDILWRQSSTGSLEVWLMNGATVALSTVPTYQGSAVMPDSTWNVVEVGNFTGSGMSDILWQQSTTGALAEWQINGVTITASLPIASQGSAVAQSSAWQNQAKPSDFA